MLSASAVRLSAVFRSSFVTSAFVFCSLIVFHLLTDGNLIDSVSGDEYDHPACFAEKQTQKTLTDGDFTDGSYTARLRFF